jgi:5-(carboxyamino)imidazole ribonucleotide mutase
LNLLFAHQHLLQPSITRNAGINNFDKHKIRDGGVLLDYILEGKAVRVRQQFMTNPSLPHPRIGIIMGSDSDLPTMQGAIQICERFHISHEVSIVSAHRTPEHMVAYAQTGHHRGLQVIIAGAGGAAHLPGMVAALTPLPVIGVPVPTKNLQGVDSLYSIVQMPAGIPVATVAIGNSTNAGLLAVQILASHDPQLLAAVQAYRLNLQEMVASKEREMTEIGYQAYLERHFPQR